MRLISDLCRENSGGLYVYHQSRPRWQGFGNCLWLDNGVVELAVTLDMGPRILYYGLREGENMLKIYDEQENAAFAGRLSSP